MYTLPGLATKVEKPALGQNMKQETMWTIIGMVGILVLSALYGYYIGTFGKTRSWSGKKIKNVAGVPIMLVGVGLMIESLLSHKDSAWERFPWVITVTGAVLAMVVAAKVSRPGVPLSELDEDNLSIR